MNKKLRVIFHIDEIDKWNLLYSNVLNLLKAGEKENRIIEVEILVNSLAVKLLEKESEKFVGIEKDFSNLIEKGVTIYGCENSLRGLKIEKNSLFPFISTVSSGVFYLVLQQNNGFSYIKP